MVPAGGGPRVTLTPKHHPYFREQDRRERLLRRPDHGTALVRRPGVEQRAAGPHAPSSPTTTTAPRPTSRPASTPAWWWSPRAPPGAIPRPATSSAIASTAAPPAGGPTSVPGSATPRATESSCSSAPTSSSPTRPAATAISPKAPARPSPTSGPAPITTRTAWASSPVTEPVSAPRVWAGTTRTCRSTRRPGTRSSRGWSRRPTSARCPTTRPRSSTPRLPQGDRRRRPRHLRGQPAQRAGGLAGARSVDQQPGRGQRRRPVAGLQLAGDARRPGAQRAAQRLALRADGGGGPEPGDGRPDRRSLHPADARLRQRHGPDPHPGGWPTRRVTTSRSTASSGCSSRRGRNPAGAPARWRASRSTSR